MQKTLTLMAASLAVATLGMAQAASGESWRDRIEQRRAESAATSADNDPTRAIAGATVLTYGTHADQRILLYPAPDRAKRPPLAIYVHGGGWQRGNPEMVDAKPAWFNGHGWAFASVGYRMLPDHPVEEQARDVGRAIAHLRGEAARLGYDPDRILLLGHSAGAHLTALVATDPGYAGEHFAAIKGALPIDGAGYDVAAQLAKGGLMTRRIYQPAFGDDPARHAALSPIAHVGKPDVAAWLLLYAKERKDSREQNRNLGDSLRSAGASVRVLAVDNDGRRQMQAHREINEAFGTRGFAANAEVEALMRLVEGRGALTTSLR
jgi:arylformamidase